MINLNDLKRLDFKEMTIKEKIKAADYLFIGAQLGEFAETDYYYIQANKKGLRAVLKKYGGESYDNFKSEKFHLYKDLVGNKILVVGSQ